MIEASEEEVGEWQERALDGEAELRDMGRKRDKKVRDLKMRVEESSKQVKALTKKCDDLKQQLARANNALQCKDDKIRIKKEKIDQQSGELLELRRSTIGSGAGPDISDSGPRYLLSFSDSHPELSEAMSV